MTGQRINVVLHRPIYPRNVGMCARSMANMGVERLILVAPQCELNENAKQGAAHAQDVLRDAVIYSSLAEFYSAEGDGIRIALSGREGHLKVSQKLDQAVASYIADSSHPIHSPAAPIYLMFGPENDGLSNEEMELCHLICSLPTFGEITSLNLSHAVLLSLYIVQNALVTQETGVAPAPRAPLYYPQETIKHWLEALGFDISSPRVNIEKTLTRILLSRSPSNEELRILDSVLQQTVRKLTRKGD